MNHEVLFSLVWVVASFYLYWPLFNRFLHEKATRKIIAGRLYGAFLFGGVPVVFLLFSSEKMGEDLGLQLPVGVPVWHLLAIAAVLLVVPLSFFQSRSTVNLQDFPQIREKIWTPRLVFWNVLSWMIYLVGYEILFRGLLLFPLVEHFGFWIAMILNVGFYSLSHAVKNFREGLGTIPIGFFLALIAWKTESVFYPILFHWAMAVGNSIFSIRHHPDMKFMK